MALTDQADGFVIADAVRFEPEGALVESATWTPALTGPARFDVHARWTAHANRSPGANYVLTHQGGTTVVTQNQQTNGAAWNLLGTFTFAPGQGVRLEASEAGYVIADAVRFTPASDQPTSGGLFYVHPDHLGTPRAITRPNDNALVWRWENAEPFGDSLPDENPSGMGAFAFNLRFPGQYFDSETGTHYNYFRDYDPTIGRYVQSDPIGLEGGINTFAYVRGNPLSLIDPPGLYDSRMRGSPGNDPYPRCAGNDPSCRSGNPRPPKPDGVLDEGCFVVCVVFGKLAVSAGNTWAVNKAANSTRAGTLAHSVAAGARGLANNPGTIGIAALYGLDYCWFNCRKDPQQCVAYEPLKPTDFFQGAP